MEWYINEPNRIVADTAPRDLFGIETAFSAFVSDTAGGTAVPLNVTFSEILEDRPTNAPASFSPSAAATAGSDTVSVDTSVVTLHADMVGYVYKVTTSNGSFYNRVKAVDTTNGVVTFKNKFPVDVATSDTIAFYGGTGAYEAQVTFSTEGERIITVRAPEYDVSVSALKVKVVPEPVAQESSVYANLIG